MIFFEQSYFVSNTVDDGYVEKVAQPPDRIYAQYRNKKKALLWYEIARTLATQLSDASQFVRTMYFIDGATGDMLDVLGRIVVMPRNYFGKVDLNPGVFADPDGSEFGDESAMFSALSTDQDSKMSDDLYRLAIKSKIIKNNSDATIDEILRNVNFLLPTAQTLRLVDNEDMSFSIEFYGRISELERWALLNGSLVPKPQGVKFNGFFEGVGYVQFGDTTAQFGDNTKEFVGFTGGS